MESIRNQYQQTLAGIAGLPVDFLRQSWEGDYSPKRHFFKHGENGIFECQWVHDAALMEKLTTAYLFWHSVPDGLKQEFWKTMFLCYLQTPEFARAPAPFCVWLFFKRFPLSSYNLLSILSEMRVTPQSLKRGVYGTEYTPHTVPSKGRKFGTGPLDRFLVRR